MELFLSLKGLLLCGFLSEVGIPGDPFHVGLLV